MTNYTDLRPGDFLTEISSYTVKTVDKDKTVLIHGESRKEVTIAKNYVELYMIPADQYTSEVIVGKEDTYWTEKQIQEAIAKGVPNASNLREGDLKAKGIRSIFLDYPLRTACAVCFFKKDKPLSAKAYEKAIEDKIAQDLQEITNGNKSLKDVLAESNKKPVLNYIPGEERVMIGYKISNFSQTSDYKFMDVKVPNPSSPGGFDHIEKSIDLSTIKWMVADGIKYILK